MYTWLIIETELKVLYPRFIDMAYLHAGVWIDYMALDYHTK
jgi:hypothetical protein